MFDNGGKHSLEPMRLNPGVCSVIDCRTNFDAIEEVQPARKDPTF